MPSSAPKPLRRNSWHLLTLVLLLAGCHAARPRRFADMQVVPAPPVALPDEQLNDQRDQHTINTTLLNRYAEAFLYEKHLGGSKPIGLFCLDGRCTAPDLLGVTALAAPGPSPLPETQSSVYLRSAERAQAVFVHQLFAHLPATASASDAIGMLSKALGDAERPAKEASPCGHASN